MGSSFFKSQYTNQHPRKPNTGKAAFVGSPSASSTTPVRQAVTVMVLGLVPALPNQVRYKLSQLVPSLPLKVAVFH